ncbi:MAG: winged helix-turn-helix domain-containing protein [Pirellulaceae bacterium]
MTAKKTTTKKAAPKAAKKVTEKETPTKVAPAKENESPAKNREGKLSAIDAAVQVLQQSKQAMNAKEMVEAMATKGLWTSPGGKTPHATLYSAILREIKVKGKDSRFKKTERGKFAANG